MKVMVDLSVEPLGVDVSMSQYIAACERIIDKAGLKYEMHAFGTNIEGAWNDVFSAIQKCHEKVHSMGAPRIHTTVKISTRSDKPETMEEKTESVDRALAEAR